MAVISIPFENAYWIRPGLLLAGDYPGSRPGYVFRTEDVVRQRVLGLVEHDINLIIDLTMPGEGEDYREILAEESRRHSTKITHVRKTITNMDIPSAEEMQDILNLIDRSLVENQAVYVHCMAGIGRTGTVVGCHLVRHGIEPGVVLPLIARLREGIPYAVYASPENTLQEEFILNWKNGL